MRQVDSVPIRVVELRLRKRKTACFGKGKFATPLLIPSNPSKIQILRRIVGVSLSKAPIEIKEKMFARTEIDFRNWLDRVSIFRSLGSLEEAYRVCKSRMEQKTASGQGSSGLKNFATREFRHKFGSPQKKRA